MKIFEVGKTYKAKDFLGHVCEYECIKRTNKTVTLIDKSYDEEFVKRIKTTNDSEYITFDSSFMGYCEMNVYAN